MTIINCILLSQVILIVCKPRFWIIDIIYIKIEIFQVISEDAAPFLNVIEGFKKNKKKTLFCLQLEAMFNFLFEAKKNILNIVKVVRNFSQTLFFPLQSSFYDISTLEWFSSWPWFFHFTARHQAKMGFLFFILSVNLYYDK